MSLPKNLIGWRRTVARLRVCRRMMPQRNILYRHSFISPYEPIVEGTGESLAELHIRAHRAITKILQMPPSMYLIVSHSEILNATLRSMMSIPMPRNAARKQGIFFRFKDTSYAHLIYHIEMDKWSFCEFTPWYSKPMC